MLSPSVRKELLKRAKEATAGAKKATEKYSEVVLKYGSGADKYKLAKANAVNLLTQFGEDKFNQIAAKKIPASEQDMVGINAILNANEIVFSLGDQFGVGMDEILKAKKVYTDAKINEKAAWDKLDKYLNDKEVIKGTKPEEYKKWKKGLRKELFG